jgi:hypothetical protein
MIAIDERSYSKASWSELLDEVHDRCFDLTQAAYSKAAGEFNLYLGDKRAGPYDEKHLKVTRVTHVRLRDVSRTQIHMLFSPTLDMSRRILTLPASGLDIDVFLGEDWEVTLTPVRKPQEWEIVVKETPSLLNRLRNKWTKKRRGNRP